MRKRAFHFLLMATLFVLPHSLEAGTRIGDIAKVQNVDSNYLHGIGLVVGLNGTGDSGDQAKRMLVNYLRTHQLEYTVKDIEAANVALVTLIAELPPFTSAGQRIPVKVTALNAKSLAGGTLLQAPLYLLGFTPEQGTVVPAAIAQGSVTVGNDDNVQTPNGQTRQLSQPTSGEVAGGAIVTDKNIGEKQNYFTVDPETGVGQMHVVLDQASFVNAQAIAQAINEEFNRATDGVDIASAVTPGKVSILIPAPFLRDHALIDFVSKVLTREVPHVDTEAVVVVNEKTGAIAMQGDITLSACVVRYAGNSIVIPENMKLEQIVQNLGDTLFDKDIIHVIHTLKAGGHLRARVVSQ